jgi:hypothetical protein
VCTGWKDVQEQLQEINWPQRHRVTPARTPDLEEERGSQRRGEKSREETGGFRFQFFIDSFFTDVTGLITMPNHTQQAKSKNNSRVISWL